MMPETAQGYWVLTRYDDIREAFQTPEVFSNHSIVPTNPDPEYRFLPSFTDPPIDMQYRHPLNPWFSPGWATSRCLTSTSSTSWSP